MGAVSGDRRRVRRRAAKAGRTGTSSDAGQRNAGTLVSPSPTRILIGYARATDASQPLAPQLSRLRELGCSQIFSDQGTGIAVQRPGLDAALAELGPDTKLIVVRLDRLAWALRDLVDLLSAVVASGAGFQSIVDGIDTDDPAANGMSVFVPALKTFSGHVVVDRQFARRPLIAGRTRLGGSRKLSDEQRAEVKRLVGAGAQKAVVARQFGISRMTIYRLLGEDAAGPALAPPS